MVMKNRRFLTIAVMLTLCILSATSLPALMRLPDVGIDYNTMTVIQPAKLMAAGMKDVKKGDKIKMTIAEDSIIFTNERSGAKAVIKSAKESRQK